MYFLHITYVVLRAYCLRVFATMIRYNRSYLVFSSTNVFVHSPHCHQSPRHVYTVLEFKIRNVYVSSVENNIRKTVNYNTIRTRLRSSSLCWPYVLNVRFSLKTTYYRYQIRKISLVFFSLSKKTKIPLDNSAA